MLVWFSWPIRSIFCWLALSLVLAGLCLPLLFPWDQSRNFSWSGHPVLFVLQSLAFYRGLQGPLPLSEISSWTQGRQGLLILAYVAMLIYPCWPTPWALPDWRCWHRLVDFGLRHLCPLFFLGASLAGLLFHRDASWMLVTQPVQVFSFLYLTFFELLLLLRRAKILGLQGWLKVKELDPEVPGRKARFLRPTGPGPPAGILCPGISLSFPAGPGLDFLGLPRLDPMSAFPSSAAGRATFGPSGRMASN